MWAKQKRQFGFTIVELLIVIVVIGILAAITIVSFNGITARARDTSRLNDANQIQQTLEAFYAENGYYPTSNNVKDISFRQTTLGIPSSVAIGYCWANTPNQYCYVAKRPPGQTGDCTGGSNPDEKCIGYTFTYRTEQDPNNRVDIKSSAGW